MGSKNPSTSVLWKDPRISRIQLDMSPHAVVFDMCQYKASHRRSTKVLSSLKSMSRLKRCCPGISGTHHHVALAGRKWCPTAKKWVWRTKEAQVYPKNLSERIADVVGDAIKSRKTHRAESNADDKLLPALKRAKAQDFCSPVQAPPSSRAVVDVRFEKYDINRVGIPK